MIPPVFSSLYNNPYLKNVQAFYAKESPISSPDPITSPAILTPFPVLPPSLLFNPRYFFIPEELLLPRKQIHSPSSSSTMLFNSSRNQTYNLVSPSSSVYTSTPPRVFKIGKCSDKMYLKHHKKQVEDILNYLDELYLHRIERMEEGRINGNELKTELKEIRTQIIKLQKKRMPPKRTSTSETPAITLDAIRQLTNDGISISCQPFCFNGTEGAVGLIRWFERTESVFSRSRCAEENKVTFATGTLTDDALSWWNAYAQPMGIEQANRTTWTELKRLLTNKYCPQTKIRKMEDELYNLSVKGNDLKPYVRRFQELTTLCPNMVPNAEKLMEVFINGLPRSIEGNVTASKPQTLEEAINISQSRIEDKKPSELILPPMDMLETFPYVRDVDYITRDLAVSSVSNEKKSDEKKLEDIPFSKEFPRCFPKDLPGLPPVRQVEFQIDLIPRAAPVARTPYRLAPSEMQELSNQLQELTDRGFI
ncbi:reverse transcriptase domain-containing protein [Tanacetum coccineum]